MYYASSSDRVLCFVVANCAKAGTSAAAVGRDAYLCISVPGIRRFRSFRGPLSAVSEPSTAGNYFFFIMLRDLHIELKIENSISLKISG